MLEDCTWKTQYDCRVQFRLFRVAIYIDLYINELRKKMRIRFFFYNFCIMVINRPLPNMMENNDTLAMAFVTGRL